MPPKLRDKGKAKKEEQESKQTKPKITTKPVKSWYDICVQEEENEGSSSSRISSSPSQNASLPDAQDPTKIDSQIKKWIASLVQSPEVVLAFSQSKEETPLKQIASQVAKFQKIERLFYKN